jgi:hypothetical protein
MCLAKERKQHHPDKGYPHSTARLSKRHRLSSAMIHTSTSLKRTVDKVITDVAVVPGVHMWPRPRLNWSKRASKMMCSVLCSTSVPDSNASFKELKCVLIVAHNVSCTSEGTSEIGTFRSRIEATILLKKRNMLETLDSTSDMSLECSAFDR